MNASGYEQTFPAPLYTVSAGSIQSLLVIVFLIIFFSLIVYTVVVGYHWLTFGHRSWLAIPALCVHIFVSGLIILFMATSLI